MNPVSSNPTSLLSETELHDLLNRYRRENWHGIQTPEWQARIVDQLIHDDGEAIFQTLDGNWSVPEHASVLDVGSGIGTFVLACRRGGLNAFGIEPDRIGQGGSLTSIQIARRRLEKPVFAAALGEQLPFRDESFDLVTMNQVLEHVSDQRAVLCEAARVLKLGGAIYMACPNYLRFYESHYKVFWFPLLPKVLGRLYLRARGRNPVLLNQLTYTTNFRLKKLMQKLGPDYTVNDLHREGFLRKRTFLSLRARLVGRAMQLPLIGRWIRNAALWFLRCTEGGCEMLVVRKSRDTL
ncbi:MAG: class I SAM-dependent methyltransferase [Terriglobales bacterium]